MISVCGYGFLDRLGENKSFELVKSCGFDAMDFSLYVGTKRGVFRGEGNVKQYYSALKQRLDELDLAVGQTHAPFGFTGTDDVEWVLDVYKRSAEATALLGCKYMVAHPIKLDGCMFDILRKECFDLNIEMFRRLAPVLKDYGVTCLLENMFYTDKSLGYKRLVPTIYSSAEELCRAADTLGDNFAVCLDTGHANITGEDLPLAVTTLGDRIKALHIHDNCAVRDEHIMPYFGTASAVTDEVFTNLGKVGYTGNVNFEVHFGGVPEQLLPCTLRYVREVGEYLQQKINSGRVQK